MTGKIIVGIILIVLGLGFLMDNFYIIDFGDYLSTYWPSALIIIGIINLFDKKSSKMSNIILILIGGIFQLNRLGLLKYDFWDVFWPILLIIIGLSFIFSRRPSVKIYPSNKVNSENTINSFAMFSGLKELNQSSSFEGGNVTAIFGGADIDLRGAELSNGEAYLELTTLFGGIDVFVPPNWRVEMSGVPIFGGWSNKTMINTDANAPVLKIKCFVAFGGIEVK